MSDVQDFQRCLQAFAEHDYATCSDQAMELFPRGAIHEVLQALLISLQRLGQPNLAEEYGQAILVNTLNFPWEHALVRFTLGRAETSAVFALVEDETERCQAHYYIGARQLTRGHIEAAQAEFEACLAIDADCVEHQLAHAEKQTILQSLRQPAGMDFHQQILDLNEQSVRLSAQRQFEEAIGLTKQALELASRHLGEDDPHYATLLEHLAIYYGKMGNYTEAEPLVRQAVELRRRTLGENHPDYATSLTVLAQLSWLRGEYSQAEPLVLAAIEIFRVTLGAWEITPQYAQSMQILATLSEEMGNYAGAASLYQQVLQLSQVGRDEDDPDYAQILTKLAELHRLIDERSVSDTTSSDFAFVRRRIPIPSDQKKLSKEEFIQQYGFDPTPQQTNLTLNQLLDMTTRKKK